MQLADPPTEPNYYMKHNFYGLFLLKLRQTHWASHDIQDFEDSLPSFVRGLSDRRKQTNYLEIGEHYIEYWKRRSGALFSSACGKC